MVFVGMDHGTTGISFAILNFDEFKYFKLRRDLLSKGKISALEELSKRVDLDEIKLMAVTYAMGDGINKIQSLDKVENRGILSIKGAGKVTGGGTKVFDEIKNSKIPAILIPGIHRRLPCLDERFKAAYSHHASAEKVSICYNAYLETGWKNMIVSDISSNTVSILLQDGEIKGGIDACLGAMGVIHGPLDLEMIRKIDSGIKTANECFSQAGAIKIAKINTKVYLAKDELWKRFKKGDKRAKLAIETMKMTIEMEIHGLAGISDELDGIVLTGSMVDYKEFYNSLKDKLNDLAPVKRLSAASGCVGSAQIARDVYNGKRNILGIEVDL